VPDFDKFRELVAAHDGVFTSADVTACAISSDTAFRRVKSGEWVRVWRGVYHVGDRSLDDRMRARIAVLSTSPRAALCSESAYWWHGFTTKAPKQIHVVTPQGRHGRAIDGVRIWHRTVAPQDLTEVDGLQITTKALTVLDAAVDGGSRLLDSALLREHTKVADVVDAQIRNSGRRGSRRSREMVAAITDGSRSEAERKALALLRSAEITGWTANAKVCGYVVDIAFIDQKVAVEIDGFAFHSDAASFQHDRTRQNVLIANGWTVLRFTWQDITGQPASVLANVRRSIARSRGERGFEL
jgi:very-short-patch-repair endonuclease